MMIENKDQMKAIVAEVFYRWNKDMLVKNKAVNYQKLREHAYYQANSFLTYLEITLSERQQLAKQQELKSALIQETPNESE